MKSGQNDPDQFGASYMFEFPSPISGYWRWISAKVGVALLSAACEEENCMPKALPIYLMSAYEPFYVSFALTFLIMPSSSEPEDF